MRLFSLQKRRLPDVSFQYQKGNYRKEEDSLLRKICGDRTRGHGYKLREGRFTLGTRKKAYKMRLVISGTECPLMWLMSHPWRLSKARMDKAWVRAI